MNGTPDHSKTYAVVGELVMIASAIDHLLNNVMIAVLGLQNSPLLEPVICGRPLGKRVFDGLIALVGCGHMSGLWCGIGPLALMIFDSPGPYHCGELGSS